MGSDGNTNNENKVSSAEQQTYSKPEEVKKKSGGEGNDTDKENTEESLENEMYKTADKDATCVKNDVPLDERGQIVAVESKKANEKEIKSVDQQEDGTSKGIHESSGTKSGEIKEANKEEPI